MSEEFSATDSVLLTGATGFIGRHLLDRLVRAGVAVHAVNRTGRGPSLPGVTWWAADLLGPAAAQLVTELAPTHLLHSAWIATPGIYSHSPENVAWLKSSLTLVEAFAAAGGRSVVGLGTCAEYDWDSSAFIEDETPIRPASVYGKCKAAFWLGVQAIAQHHGMRAAWGRIFLPYGPGDEPRRLIPSVCAALAEGRPVETGDPRQERDFLFAPDAAEILVRMLVHPAAEGAFNIGTGRATAIGEVVERLARAYGRTDLLRLGALPPRPGEPRRLIADMAKVERVLGWAAPTDVASGIDAFLANFSANAPTTAVTPCGCSN